MQMRGQKIYTAIEFLKKHVAGREVLSTEVYKLAKEAGISRRTLERAKSELGVCSMHRSDRWVWVMAEHISTKENTSIDSQSDLPVIYTRPQEQKESAVEELHRSNFSEEIQQLDLSELKRVFLICGSSKFRGKFDSFSVRVPQALEMNIMIGDAFVFCNRTRTQVSVLQWQGDGFAQYFKRSDYGQFPWSAQRDAQAVEITPEDLKMLLEYPRLMLRLSGISMFRISA
jgi:transposase